MPSLHEPEQIEVLPAACEGDVDPLTTSRQGHQLVERADGAKRRGDARVANRARTLVLPSPFMERAVWVWNEVDLPFLETDPGTSGPESQGH